jgi:hypothetical protein
MMHALLLVLVVGAVVLAVGVDLGAAITWLRGRRTESLVVLPS